MGKVCMRPFGPSTVFVLHLLSLGKATHYSCAPSINAPWVGLTLCGFPGGVPGPPAAQVFTSFGACTKLLLVWIRGPSAFATNPLYVVFWYCSVGQQCTSLVKMRTAESQELLPYKRSSGIYTSSFRMPILLLSLSSLNSERSTSS